MLIHDRYVTFVRQALLVGSAAILGAGCSGGASGSGFEEVGSTRLTFEEFESRVHRESGDGAYVVEGDIRIHGRKALKTYFDKHVQSGALIVAAIEDEDWRWNDIHKRALTYCVSPRFGVNFDAVVDAMSNATAAWSSVAPVTFTHVSSEDVMCDYHNGNVLFDVSPTREPTSYFAAGFYPMAADVYTRGQRSIDINPRAFGDIAPLSLTGVLRHVLGHTLGFTHESNRPETPPTACRSSTDPRKWRPLTPYDPSSVMSFVEWDCANHSDPVLTQRDAAGAAALYGRAPVSTNASQDGRIAVLSRMPQTIDVFWIGVNGAVNHSFWNKYFSGYAKWETEELAPRGSAAPRGSIAAVSRTPTSMELWYIGANGSIQDMFWYEAGNWSSFELAPPGSASLDGGIAAVSRAPTAMELWYIGADGSIQDKYWYEWGRWEGFQLAPPGAASPHGSIAAVSRVPTSMDLWYIGANGSIQNQYWNEGAPNWGTKALAGANAASLNGSIAAVSRVPTSMDLWYIGADGSVQNKYWNESATNWGTKALTSPNAAALNGSIAAVSRVPTSIELWYIGADGSIQDKYWYEGATNWGGHALTGPNAATLNGSIAAVWRMPQSMELWFNGANGSLQDKYWYEGNPWSGFEIAPAGSTAQ